VEGKPAARATRPRSPLPRAERFLAARFPSALRRRAAGLRVVGLDSDGTLTDRGMGWDDEGRELRRFDVRDGLSMVWAMRAGLHLIVISGRSSGALVHRAEDLGVPIVQGVKDKVSVFAEFCARHGATADQAAFIGDDLPDLAVMRWCALPIAVADAHPRVRDAALWSTPSPGGQGAVREVLEAVLDATGHWSGVLDRYGDLPVASPRRR
jgi:3-deoxy-D-manno-octulosonate 8-phosphate phosphatase (KDO 8-P phosphatase)